MIVYPYRDFGRLIAKRLADEEAEKRVPVFKRPFDSGRTLPRDEGLERAIKQFER